jgi:hypothetical protein
VSSYYNGVRNRGASRFFIGFILFTIVASAAAWAFSLFVYFSRSEVRGPARQSLGGFWSEITQVLSGSTGRSTAPPPRTVQQVQNPRSSAPPVRHR